MLTLSFLGAAGEVTGSSYLVDTGTVRVLVDCGMFQGGRDADAKNRAALGFDVGALDAVLLTHAHIDHSGLLPRLCARGFRGPIYATPATCDLVAVMLQDSAHIQEKDAQWARERAERSARPAPGHRKETGGHHRRAVPAHGAGQGGHGRAADAGRRRGGDAGAGTSPPADDDLATPLYTVAEAQACLRQFKPVGYDQVFAPAPGVEARFRDAGHILGSAVVEAWFAADSGRHKIVFSGDLGQPGRPLVADPVRVPDADTVVVESTYGNRLHRSLASTYDELAQVLATTLPRGNVVIPAFAVGRTQEVIHVLADLVRQQRAPTLTVFVDSPLATMATRIHSRYGALQDGESREVARWLAAHPQRMRVLFTETPQDSMAINAISRGAVIIAASGMCEGGRIRHHLRHLLPRSEAAIVFTGFQAAGTMGRALVDGARHVRLFREDVPVRASLHTIGGLSAHGDRAALLGWLSGFTTPPARAFVVHGERDTAEGFADALRDELHFPSVTVPGPGARFDLG